MPEFVETWMWLIAKASFGLVLVALAVVLISAKFRRKVWWALLAVLSGAWTVSAGDEVMLVGLPVGAAYVLLFALFGPRPVEAPAKS